MVCGTHQLAPPALMTRLGGLSASVGHRTRGTGLVALEAGGGCLAVDVCLDVVAAGRGGLGHGGRRGAGGCGGGGGGDDGGLSRADGRWWLMACSLFIAVLPPRAAALSDHTTPTLAALHSQHLPADAHGGTSAQAQRTANPPAAAENSSISSTHQATHGVYATVRCLRPPRRGRGYPIPGPR